jgi:hypothetical protein
MSNIFTLENLTDFSAKMNIDDLYERKKQQDLNKMALFDKLLNRVHIKIKTVSKQKMDDNFCWFLVPETILGVPKYDQALCIAYLMDKLKISGFNVRYIHPNLLFISWMHWVPSYVRTEIKKKTGISVNEYGEKIEEESNDDFIPPLMTNNATNNNNNNNNNNNSNFNIKIHPDDMTKGKPLKKDYTPIKSYRPSGNLVYDDELLDKINNKFG